VDLEARLEKWRDLQVIHMSSVRPCVLVQSPCTVEDANLFLPSSMMSSEHDTSGILSLAAEEITLREAQAHESILQLRLTMKAIAILHRQRKRHVRGQRQSTRARSKIHSIEATRDRFLTIYNTSREALIALGRLNPSEERLPLLTLDDLRRKSTMDNRQINDTYRSDGRIWTMDTSRQTSDHSTGKNHCS
jgi:hypothetical protein